VTTDTVADAVTGLIWQRVVPTTAMTLADANTYCWNLTLAGSPDWRLPTLIEVESIVDYSTYNPSINAAAFPSTPAIMFWSSSPFALNASNAWVVDFYYGYTYSVGPADAYGVRCVR
jgi:hypothetical protein